MEEAEELLQSKLNTASLSKSNAEEDMEFLRDQITTMEVSILFGLPNLGFCANPNLCYILDSFLDTARIYNWDVKMRRIAKASKAGTA